MKVWIKAGIIGITLAVEMILNHFLDIHVVKPDLVLITVISLSFILGAEEGVIVGFFGGFIKDIFSVHFLGLHAFVKTVIGYCVGMIREKIFNQHLIWLILIFTFLFTIINDFILYFLLNSLYTYHDFIHVVQKMTLLKAILNSLIAPFVFLGIKRIMDYFQHRS